MSGCVDASMATLPSSKSQGVSPARTTTIVATRLLPVSRLASSPRRRIAASTSAAENPRATCASGPVILKIPASTYG